MPMSAFIEHIGRNMVGIYYRHKALIRMIFDKKYLKVIDDYTFLLEVFSLLAKKIKL